MRECALIEKIWYVNLLFRLALKHCILLIMFSNKHYFSEWCQLGHSGQWLQNLFCNTQNLFINVQYLIEKQSLEFRCWLVTVTSKWPSVELNYATVGFYMIVHEYSSYSTYKQILERDIKHFQHFVLNYL
jgi:hypothetical protein